MSARQRWMGALARAEGAAIAALLRDLPAPLPAHARLRAPETGLVMVRGRQGGDGAAFNLGEMTVTRCSVRLLPEGPVGHAYVAGRDPQHAETAAVLDAALQDPHWQGLLLDAVIAPLERAEQARREERARKAAATRVEFFTLATMR